MVEDWLNPEPGEGETREMIAPQVNIYYNKHVLLGRFRKKLHFT